MSKRVKEIFKHAFETKPPRLIVKAVREYWALNGITKHITVADIKVFLHRLDELKNLHKIKQVSKLKPIIKDYDKHLKYFIDEPPFCWFVNTEKVHRHIRKYKKLWRLD